MIPKGATSAIELEKQPGFLNGWQHCGPHVIAYVNELLIKAARGIETSGHAELANLLNELREIKIEARETVAPAVPRMPPLHAFSDSANPNQKANP